MDQKELTALKNKATELRIRAVDMIWKAQSGHPGGSLSVAEFMTACYLRASSPWKCWTPSARKGPPCRAIPA